MSTQSIISKSNLPTGEVVGILLAKVSTDLIKNLRFEIGEVCHIKMVNILRLSRLHCNNFCYLDQEQETKVREYLIKQAITKIEEL